MKKKRILKLISMFIVLGIFINVISVYSKDTISSIISYYDNLLKSNQLTIYTDEEINNEETFEQAIRKVTGYLYNSGLQLNPTTIDYEKKTCDFDLYDGRSPEYTVVKKYDNIEINIDKDIASYFEMLKDDNLVITHDRSMITSSEESYINSYLANYSSYIDDKSISYIYDDYSKTITMRELNNGLTTKVVVKKINKVIFDTEEKPYSDEFKKLTTNGTITIKTDSKITTGILSSFLNDYYVNGYSFLVDGDIVNNKVYIKLVEYKEGKSTIKEKHLINLVQDPNINTANFKKPSYEKAVSIPAERPTKNISDYIQNYFNHRSLHYENERYEKINDYNNTEFAVIKYIKTDKNGKSLYVEFHKVPIEFTGYKETTSSTFKKKVGDEVLVRADKLDLQTINTSLNYNPQALGCNDDYSYCDLELVDYDTNEIEIHKVKITLDNTISDNFKKAFNLKADNSIEIFMSEDAILDDWLNYYDYDELTNNSLQYNCDFTKDTCNLTLRNYHNKAEQHTVKYNKIFSEKTPSYTQKVKSSVDIYPGETNDFWDKVRYSNKYFLKNDKDTRTRINNCDEKTSKCSVITLNSDNNLEIHNSTVNIKPGKSEDFLNVIPTDTVKLNSIYKDDPEYLYRASLGYFMSKTRTWSYLSDYDSDKAKAVFDNIETHTVNVEFAKENKEQIARKITDQHITIDDLEFVNNFYYNDDLTNLFTSNYNSKSLYDTLTKIINNKHVSYFFVMEGGGGTPFLQSFAGSLVLYYDGIAYSITNSLIELTSRNIIYIPDNTENTQEAFIKAAQKRIDDYFGKDSGIVISYSRKQAEDELTENAIYETPSDDNVYQISYKDKTQELIIIKNSKKIKKSTFSATDVNNNVNIQSTNATYPANTVVSSEKIEIDSEYKNVLKKLGVTDAEIIDINLYSPTIGNIKDFSNVEFDVEVPLENEKLRNKKLYAYYIDDNGNIEEHPVTVDDFIAKFKTNHFSTYIISEKTNNVKNVIDELNPNTNDTIFRWVLLELLSIIGFICSIVHLRKRNFEK